MIIKIGLLNGLNNAPNRMMTVIISIDWHEMTERERDTTLYYIHFILFILALGMRVQFNGDLSVAQSQSR